MEYKKGVRTYVLTPSRKHVGKSIARRSKSAVVANCFKDPVTKVYALKRVGTLLRN